MQFYPDVEYLMAALLRETSCAGSFATSPPQDMRVAEETFARYRLSALAVIRLTDRDARRMFLSGLRGIGIRPFPEMQIIVQIPNHFAPQLVNPRANANDPPFEEVVLPERLRAYAADLPSLAGFVKPNHMMANYSRKELSKGLLKAPSYAPVIVPGISQHPWPDHTAEHSSDLDRWKANRPAAKTLPRRLRLNTWHLYRMRFVVTSDVLKAWGAFGGSAAQINRFSIAMHIATTESAAASLAYDALLCAHIGALSRSRSELAASNPDFGTLLRIEQNSLKLQAIAQKPKPVKEAPPNAAKVPKGPPAKPRKQPRIPKEDYLYNLAEGRSKQAPPPPPARSPSRKNQTKRSDPPPPKPIA